MLSMEPTPGEPQLPNLSALRLQMIGTPLQPGAAQPNGPDAPSLLESTADDVFSKILSFLSTLDTPTNDYGDILENLRSLCTSSNSALTGMCDRSGIYDRLCVKFGLGGSNDLALFATKLGLEPTSFTSKDAILTFANALGEMTSMYPVEYNMFVDSTEAERMKMASAYVEQIDEGQELYIPMLAYLAVLSGESSEFQSLLQSTVGYYFGGRSFDRPVNFRLARLLIRLIGSINIDQPSVISAYGVNSWIDHLRNATNMLQDTGRYITQIHHSGSNYVELRVDESGLRRVLAIVDTYRPILTELENMAV